MDFSWLHSTFEDKVVLRQELFNVSYFVPIFVPLDASDGIPLHAVYGLEVLLILLSSGLMPITARHLGRTHFLHSNLMYLIRTIFAYAVISFLTRLYLIAIQLHAISLERVDQLAALTVLVSVTRTGFLGVAVNVLPSIVIERCFATYYVKDYEKNPRPWIFVVTLCYVIVSTLFFSVPMVLWYFSIAYYVFTTIIVMVISLLAFVFVFFGNKVEAQNLESFQRKNRVFYSLSRRYQVQENKTVIFMVRNLCCAIACLTTAVTIAFLVSISNGLSSPTGIFCLTLFDLIIAAAGVVLPAICYMSLPKQFRLPLKKLLLGFHRRESTAVPSSTGDQRRATMESYFQQLEQSWK